MNKMIKTLNFLHQEGNENYQNLVPQATIDNIKEVGNAILELEANKNEFITNLVNKIAFTEVMGPNPSSLFGEFIGRDLLYGDTIESIFVSVAKAKTFEGGNLKDGDSLDPFKVTKPNVEVAYHRIDRKEYFTVTVQDDMIKNAFNNPASFGEFVNEIIRSLEKGVDLAIYTDGLELLDRDGTDGKSNIYGDKVELGVFTDAKAMAASINNTVKDRVTYLPFMSKKYNTLGEFTNTRASDIVVFMRADIQNLIDTELLYAAFNPEKLGMGATIKVVDAFNDAAQVVSIIDRSALHFNFSVRKTTNQYNPLGLYTNYFSHIHRLVSYNPFANAIKISATFE